MSQNLVGLVKALPKAELHVHLEGSITPELAFQLATRHGIRLPGIEQGIPGIRSHYRSKDFDGFVQMFLAISRCLQDVEDFTQAVIGLARNLAAQNVVYAEVTCTPMTHYQRGVSIDTMIAGLHRGRQAAADVGVDVRWVFDIVRIFPDQAEPTLAFAHAMDAQEPESVVGLGLGGPEQESAPYAAFAPTFRRAREAGIAALPHAGELAGAASVWGAIEALGARRIGHGVRCLEDPKLVDYLREHQVTLEVCPSSNVALGVVPSWSEHPLPKLLEAGLSVTLATDDPALVDTTLNDEYLRCIQAFGWDEITLRQVAAAAVRSALGSPEKMAAVREQQDAVPC